MSSKLLNRLWKTTGVQLTLWYSIIFILSSISLFALSYVLLSTSLQKKDHEFIRAKLNDYGMEYNLLSFQEAVKEMDAQVRTDNDGPYLLRVANAENKTLYLNVPESLAGYRPVRLENRPLNNKNDWIRLKKKKDEDVIDIASFALKDGNTLQLGKSSEERDEILAGFMSIFGIILFAMIAIGFVAGAVLTHRVLSPIRGVVSAVRMIVVTGNMTSRVPVRQTGDELDDLSILFNQMIEKVEKLILGMKGALDNVAHDLRTPVTRLRGIAEVALRSEKKHDVCQEALADTVEESEQVMAMLTTLMDISEAETGTMKLNLQTFDLSDLIDSVVELYQYVADEKKIRLSALPSKELMLSADRNRVRQVIANLVDNAIKFTPIGGKVEILAERKDSGIIISVQDTGIGIPMEEISKIWERLYRGDQSRSEKGLGLGLSFVKAIVEAHHGSITVSSQPGTGSRFTLLFPLR